MSDEQKPEPKGDFWTGFLRGVFTAFLYSLGTMNAFMALLSFSEEDWLNVGWYVFLFVVVLFTYHEHTVKR
jgi:hypothetical protein